jgi:hypothetical protein
LRFSARLPIEVSEDGIMDAAMTEFRLSTPACAPGLEARPGDPLAEMADEVRRVNEAAARAAIRVGAAAAQLRGEPGADFRSELLADLGTSLVERVNEIHAECERLAGTLARAAKLASSEKSTVPPSPPAPVEIRAFPEIFKPAAARNGAEHTVPEPAEQRPSERAQQVAPEPTEPPRPRPRDRRRAPGQSTPEGVRLAATQMAVAGSSRWEIERCLRIQFGVRDADTALDEIFGTRQNEVR